jgi:hypothetical protein
MKMVGTVVCCNAKCTIPVMHVVMQPKLRHGSIGRASIDKANRAYWFNNNFNSLAGSIYVQNAPSRTLCLFSPTARFWPKLRMKSASTKTDGTKTHTSSENVQRQQHNHNQ